MLGTGLAFGAVGKGEEGREGEGRGGGRRRTVLPAPNFFSVPITAPLLWAALRALLPRTTVSRDPPPAPRVLLPIFVTVSQSSMIAVVVLVLDLVKEFVKMLVR